MGIGEEGFERYEKESKTHPVRGRGWSKVWAVRRKKNGGWFRLWNDYEFVYTWGVSATYFAPWKYDLYLSLFFRAFFLHLLGVTNCSTSECQTRRFGGTGRVGDVYCWR